MTFKIRTITLIASILFLAVAANSIAQEEEIFSLEGTEFNILFMQNRKAYKPENNINLDMELALTGASDTKVSIKSADGSFSAEAFVRADSLTRVALPPEQQLTSSIDTQKRAIYIRSEKPILVYGISSSFNSTETFSAIPVSSLGNRYFAASMTNLGEHFYSQYAILTTHDNTNYRFLPRYSSDLEPIPEDRAIYNTFNEGYAMGVIHLGEINDPSMQMLNFDLSGSLAEADKDFAFFSGHQCANIPVHIPSCNHLVEQIMPVKHWGREYIVRPMAKRSKYNLRIYAANEGTDLEINGEWVDQMTPGMFYELTDQDGFFHIKSSEPVMVVQYAQGHMNGDEIGDPMMMMIRPVEHFAKKIRFATPVKGKWLHYINITVYEDAAASLKIDGKPIDSRKYEFKRVEGTKFVSVAIPVEYGVHVIECEKPLGINSYGFLLGKKNFDAYGNM